MLLVGRHSSVQRIKYHNLWTLDPGPNYFTVWLRISLRIPGKFKLEIIQNLSLISRVSVFGYVALIDSPSTHVSHQLGESVEQSTQQEPTSTLMKSASCKPQHCYQQRIAGEVISVQPPQAQFFSFSSSSRKAFLSYNETV